MIRNTHKLALRFAIYFVVILLCASATYAWQEITQTEFDKVSKNSTDFYKDKEHYSVKVVHASYRGHGAVTAYEQIEGYYRFDHGSYHSLLAGIHTIQNNTCRVVIDTAAKSILVGDLTNNKADDVSEINYKNSMMDVKKFMKCPIGTAMRYRLEYNEKPLYESYETEINASGMMSEMLIYYRKEYQINPQDANSAKAKPKLKITWTEFSEKTVFAADEFSTQKYFTESNGKLTPTPKYKGYRITDVRVKK